MLALCGTAGRAGAWRVAGLAEVVAVASCVFAHEAPGDGAEFGLTGEAHRELELCREHPEDSFDSGLPEGGEAPEWRPADENGFSSE